MQLMTGTDAKDKSTSVSFTQSLSQNTWYHIGINVYQKTTSTDDQLELYVNGQLRAVNVLAFVSTVLTKQTNNANNKSNKQQIKQQIKQQTNKLN